MIIEQLPPHDQESEAAILGSLLIDTDAIFEVNDILQPEDLYLLKHQWIYQAMLDLNELGEPVDLITLSTMLQNKKHLEECGGDGYLINLINTVPTSVNARYYAKIVHECALRRRIINAAGKIASAAYDKTLPITTVQDEAEQSLFKARGEMAYQGISKPQRYMSDWLADMDRMRQSGHKITGLSTGLNDLDRMLDGLQAPHQYVLAARPGMGKSALALNIADRLSMRDNKRILFFSLEMSDRQTVNRRLSAHTSIEHDKIRSPWKLSPAEVDKIFQATGRMSEAPFFIDTTPGISPSQIRAKAMRVYAEHGVDLIVVDHLHIMQPDSKHGDRRDWFGDMTISLRDLGKQLNVPILTLAQLNRSLESRADKRPQLSDLRESGAIEENAFAVMFIYRPGYYDEMENQNQAEIIIAKHRDGATGTVHVYSDLVRMRFRNLVSKEINL